MAHSYRLVLVTLGYQVRKQIGSDICHRGYTMLQSVQRHGVYSAAYGRPTVHYKEPLKSLEIRVGHSHGFGLPSVAILPHCAKSDVKHYSLTHSLTCFVAMVSVPLRNSSCLSCGFNPAWCRRKYPFPTLGFV